MPLGFNPYDDATTVWEAVFAPVFFLLVLVYIRLAEKIKGVD